MFNKSSSGDAKSIYEANETATRKTPQIRQSVIGPTLTFKGEVSADEDLLIQGRIEGKIAHHKHNLTIGKEGRVKADIHARVITVEGHLEGNLHGDETVVLKATAQVTGNIFSPRITVEDGAMFNGSVTMESDQPVVAIPDAPMTASELREAG